MSEFIIKLIVEYSHVYHYSFRFANLGGNVVSAYF